VAEWVTQTEVEFDTAERDSWYALREIRDATCPYCGNLKVVCSQPDGLDGRGYYPQRTICYISAAKEAADRRWRELHKDVSPDPNGTHPMDGVYVWASPLNLTPDDDFLPAPQVPDWLQGLADNAEG
jgi:hypothetical protein